MKRLISGLIFLTLAAFPVISSADSAKTLTILFTGSVKGEIDPCAA